jgi:hypothetical protein
MRRRGGAVDEPVMIDGETGRPYYEKEEEYENQIVGIKFAVGGCFVHIVEQCLGGERARRYG